MTMQATATSPKTQVYPLFDVFESEAEFLLVADLPGVTRPNLELAVEQGELRLTAQSEGVEYRRSFKLGDDVDEASGVQEVTRPLTVPDHIDLRPKIGPPEVRVSRLCHDGGPAAPS